MFLHLHLNRSFFVVYRISRTLNQFSSQRILKTARETDLLDGQMRLILQTVEARQGIVIHVHFIYTQSLFALHVPGNIHDSDSVQTLLDQVLQ